MSGSCMEATVLPGCSSRQQTVPVPLRMSREPLSSTSLLLTSSTALTTESQSLDWYVHADYPLLPSDAVQVLIMPLPALNENYIFDARMQICSVRKFPKGFIFKES